MSTQKDEILRIVSENPGVRLPNKEFAQRLSFPEDSIRRCISLLYQKGSLPELYAPKPKAKKQSSKSIKKQTKTFIPYVPQLTIKQKCARQWHIIVFQVVATFSSEERIDFFKYLSAVSQEALKNSNLNSLGELYLHTENVYDFSN